jgi:hypothetical protein
VFWINEQLDAAGALGGFLMKPARSSVTIIW